MAVTISSYNEILGKLVRKMIADTPVNDINRGSVLLTLLEAVAAQDFENSANILSILESLSIDALKNSDLDQRAADYGLIRTPAAKATGFVTIKDTSISKRSTTLYAIKPPPIKGSTVLYVNNAVNWDPAGGSLYIGRGTQQFEGPVSYSSIVNNGSFYKIILSSALQYDHLASDSVVDAQSTVDRQIASGTVVKIPANNQNPEILYSTLRDSVIPAGEDSVSGVSIIANQVGSFSNAGINTIVEFSSLPFSTAAVYNSNSLTDGRDTESDDDLRERVKSYTSTLARGTREAILSSIIGISDSTDGKQVSSAVITEPAIINDPSIIYIDDGSGFQPTFKGQSVDVVLASATGGEEFLQLANFPLPRPQIINQTDGPYSLIDQSTLSVLVDNTDQQITFKTSQFNNIAAATLEEVATAINDQSTTFKCRLTDNSTRLLLYPTSHNVEFIQVASSADAFDSQSYANSYLKFPTNKYSYITLYKNNTLLSEKEFPAILRTIPKSNWGITGNGTLILEVDGTPAQNRSFSALDFDGQSFNVLTVADWVSAFNKKFAGIKAVATTSDQIEIYSNLIGTGSSLKIIGGSYSSSMFAGADIYSEGKTSEYALNRQTGNLQIKTLISAGDSITAGSVDAKGNVISTSTTGSFNLTSDSFERPAEVVIIADGSNTVFRSEVSPIIGTSVTVSVVGNRMRVTSNVSTLFPQAQLNDYIYIAYRGVSSSWLPYQNCGLFKIRAKGSHINAGVDSWVEVDNQGAVGSSNPYYIQASEDIQVFSADSYPQIWKGSFVDSPGSATIKSVVDSINTNLENVKSSIYKTNSVKITSSTENNGSIATPVSIGLMSNVFASEVEAQLGNQSNVATKITEKDLIGYFKRTPPISNNIWLGRYVYTDLRGSLTSNSEPNPAGYSEILNLSSSLNSSTLSHDNVLNVTSGSNKSHFRNIKEFLSSSSVGTQVETPTTIFDYVLNNDLSALEALTISADDSIVFILDGDSVNKTINVNFWRTGRVNSNYYATNTSFSADDADNESGIDFGNQQVWSKTNTNTEFKDYAAWFRSRNWYKTNGTLGSDAGLIVRAKEYGPSGDKYRFKMEYPSAPDQSYVVSHANTTDDTVCTYIFASGSQISTGITSGTSFTVLNLSDDNYRLTFKQSTVDFSSLNPMGGDLISITDPNIKEGNRGVFRINAFNDIDKTIDISNTNAEVTVEGSPEEHEINTVADIIGTPGILTITCTSQGSTPSTPSTVGSGDFFILRDNQDREILFWYAIENVGTQPSVNAYQYVKIGTVITGNLANQVASATAAIINSAHPDFNAVSSGNDVVVTNNFNGPVTLDQAGSSGTGFVYSKSDGIDNDTLGGSYFKLYDKDGSVAIWMNVYGESEPIHGADRSIQVVIPSGSSASNVASLISASIDADSEFIASSSSTTMTIVNAKNGNVENADLTMSGFTLNSHTDGVDDEVETVTSSPGIKIFPIINNDAQTVSDNINNTSSILTTVPIGDVSKLFTKATRDESYSVAYQHAASDSSIKMFDGESFVKIFSNNNPHFVLKKDLQLQGQALSVYDMRTCLNPNTTDTGEFFKLLPKTIKNVKHHLNHRALSQLPIVADVDICNKFRRIQIKSKKLGTAGAVEIVGGRANLGEFSIFGDSQVATGSSYDFLEIKVSAFPSTINAGDVVKIYNEKTAKRLSRLSGTDSIDISLLTGGDCEYHYNKKQIYSSPFTAWTITDVSSSYSKNAGIVWRWQHNEAGRNIKVTSETNGIVSILPNEYPSSGTTPGAVGLEVFNIVNGTSSSQMSFYLSISDTPNQASYFTFQNAAGVSFAVWFAKDGDTTAPTGTPYLNANNKIKVDILSTDSQNSIVSKLEAAMDTGISVFTTIELPETDLLNVLAGDVVGVWGNSSFSNRWSTKNQSQSVGDGEISNFPIIAVDSENRYIDVVNPNGCAMSGVLTRDDGNIEIFPSIGIRWRIKHSAYVSINNIVVSSGTAAVSTSTSHGFGVGDVIEISSAGNINLNGLSTVVSAVSPSSFTFTTAASDGTYYNGNAILSSKTITKYKTESLNFNNLIRISRVSGDAPLFVDCGVAVDDFVQIDGSTFSSVNNGRFRVLAVDNDSFVISNPNFKEELKTFVKFNDLDKAVVWTTNSTQIVGAAGNFANLLIGSWVKKKEDGDDHLVQVIGFDTGSPLTAAVVELGSKYVGADSVSVGISIDQEFAAEQGVILQNENDIAFYEADSVTAGDSLVIENISNPSWFNTSNSGVFSVKNFGTSAGSRSQFVRVYNSGAVSQTKIDMSIKTDGFYLLENQNNKYESIRIVEHAAISEFNSNQRTLYITPSHQVNKVSNLYGSKVQSLGKLGFEVGVTTGVDGYSYYTGLMQTVQRIVDGYEPDPTNYPGRRAVGSAIEILPPLIKQISITLDITTKDGVNLTEITNDIKSTVINYVNSLGVGEDVILSEIIARTMSINGVDAVTFTNPAPTNERIAINDDQKAFISPELISLS